MIFVHYLIKIQKFVYVFFKFKFWSYCMCVTLVGLKLNTTTIIDWRKFKQLQYLCFKTTFVRLQFLRRHYSPSPPLLIFLSHSPIKNLSYLGPSFFPFLLSTSFFASQKRRSAISFWDCLRPFLTTTFYKP